MASTGIVVTMNFSEIINSLSQASAFQLYRMRANGLRGGRIFEMRRKQAVILDPDDTPQPDLIEICNSIQAR